jgi:hypothetical protein
MRFAFRAGAMLATAGIVLAVGGIQSGEPKPIGIGLVLLMGAGVFAILSLGVRRANRLAEPSEDDT